MQVRETLSNINCSSAQPHTYDLTRAGGHVDIRMNKESSRMEGNGLPSDIAVTWQGQYEFSRGT